MLPRLIREVDNYVAELLAGIGTRWKPKGRELSTHRDETGFTLIEMLVVITIIGFIMRLVGPRVLSYLSDSKVKTAHIQIQGFSAALDLYYLDNGRYPTSSEGLGALTQKLNSAATWNGPYLKSESVPNDPWGRPYVYKSPGQRGPYEIVSLGPDGREGDRVVAANATNAQR